MAVGLKFCSKSDGRSGKPQMRGPDSLLEKNANLTYTLENCGNGYGTYHTSLIQRP